jgi:hypothetical protein
VTNQKIGLVIGIGAALVKIYFWLGACSWRLREFGIVLQNPCDSPDSHPELFGNRADAGATLAQFNNPLPVEDSLGASDRQVLPRSAVDGLAHLAGVVILLVPQGGRLGSAPGLGTFRIQPPRPERAAEIGMSGSGCRYRVPG